MPLRVNRPTRLPSARSTSTARPCCSASPPIRFNGLHSRQRNEEVQFYACEVLARQSGEDLRPLPPHLRKYNLARLLACRLRGIFLSDVQQGDIGPDLFRHAFIMKAPRTALRRRALSSLDQGQEPEPSLHRQGQGSVFLTNILVGSSLALCDCEVSTVTCSEPWI